MTYTMNYNFGDLDTTVEYTHYGAPDVYSSDPMAGGIVILHVYVGKGIDILGALTPAQLDDIGFYAEDNLAA